MEALVAGYQRALTYWWKKAQALEKRVAELEKELADRR